MVTDEKVKAGENLNIDDNINTRDMKRSAVILLILGGLFLWFLVGLGSVHKHAAPGSSAAHPEVMQGQSQLSSERPVGFLELPGKIGKSAAHPKDMSPTDNAQTVSSDKMTPSGQVSVSAGSSASKNEPAGHGH